MKLSSLLISATALAQSSLAFVVFRPATTHTSSRLFISTSSAEEDQSQEQKLGNLVADDEWNGLSLELAEIVRLAVVEDLKRNTREFLGKEDYKVGDVSKEIDSRVKQGGACVYS